MKKDIYIIKNNFNEKIYIGQSNNVSNRWKHHLSNAKLKRTVSLVDRAIFKYGADNFYYEIIEKQVENYNEREIYWIKYYNSLHPNGYNICIGGNGTGSGIYNPNSSIKTEGELYEIINAILNTDQSFNKIAKKYNISEYIVSAINRGESYFNKDLVYPLRQFGLTKDELNRLVYSLKYEHNKSFKDLHLEYNLDTSCINDINQGKTYFREYLDYPLRKGKVTNPLYEHYREIINLLKDTNLPQKEIAKTFNVGAGAVSNINLGRSYKQDNIDYPIRTNYQYKKRKSFSPDEILEIENLLANSDLSMKKIANQFETVVTIIMDLNNGFIKRFHKDNIKYPIRDSRN